MNIVKMNNCSVAICLLLAFGLSGCAGISRYKGPDPTDQQSPDHVVCADLAVLPQKMTPYAERAGIHKLLLPLERQNLDDALFNERFFKPWTLAQAQAARDAFLAVQAMKPARGFIENNRPFPLERWETLTANCALERYPGKIRYGITVRNTSLRLMPTDTPFFLHPRKGGEGFPFDYFQNSALWAGAPLAITHTSRDGLWVYVETRAACGWAPVAHVAEMDAAMRKLWQRATFAAILKDGTLLRAHDGPADAASGERPSIVAHIGAMFPLAAGNTTGSGTLRVMLPTRGADGKARARVALLDAHDAAQRPLPLTPGNIARVADTMMGQPYGWGGLFEQRDCSAAMRDLFAPFGIWLPRNSGEQARWGRRITVAGLSADEKERAIMAQGIPFLSLVCLHGHVGLYLGNYPVDGVERPVMFHNIWGIRVKNPYKQSTAVARKNASSGNDEDAGRLMYAIGADDRAIIGKTVITTLRPGAELPWIASPASLLDRIDGLSILPEFEGKDMVPKKTANSMRKAKKAGMSNT